MLLNKANRGLLSHQYQRVLFHHPKSQLTINDSYSFNTVHQPLTATNLSDALLASGSIPLVMEGIKNIEGCAPGMYRDGGIIDYHFDITLEPNEGLILYPHFNAAPKAGWFDKNSSRAVDTGRFYFVLFYRHSLKSLGRLARQHWYRLTLFCLSVRL